MSDGIIHRSLTYNKTGYLSGAAILTSALTPKKGVSRFSITFAANASAKFSVTMTDGTTSTTLDFNGGVALTAGSVFQFDLRVTSGMAYNFVYASNATINLLQVDEIVQES